MKHFRETLHSNCMRAYIVSKSDCYWKQWCETFTTTCTLQHLALNKATNKTTGNAISLAMLTIQSWKTISN